MDKLDSTIQRRIFEIHGENDSSRQFIVAIRCAIFNYHSLQNSVMPFTDMKNGLQKVLASIEKITKRARSGRRPNPLITELLEELEALRLRHVGVLAQCAGNPYFKDKRYSKTFRKERLVEEIALYYNVQFESFPDAKNERFVEILKLILEPLELFDDNIYRLLAKIPPPPP